jgi:hypothetical protein
MTCCGSENDFCKKLGARLIRAKGQTHPGFSKIGRRLRKIQKITLKVWVMKKELICVPHVVYYLCGVLCTAFCLSFW